MTPPRFDIGTDLLAGTIPARFAIISEADLAEWPWAPGQPTTAPPASPLAPGEGGRTARAGLVPWVDGLDLPGI